MTYRWTELRTVDPATSSDLISPQPVSLWWLALAAADETIQGGPLTTAWLRLFSAHLSRRDVATLCWKGDMAASAEMRRAYSAMYGRYVARALLASRLGLVDFVSLGRDRTTLPGGVVVERTSWGDIPDWIAWDPVSGAFVLGEAKGSLSGSAGQFASGTPACVAAGKAQFGRVRVRGPRGPIRTRNWVVASLWATDDRRSRSVSLLWDPPGEGVDPGEAERRQFAGAMRRRRVAAQAVRLGRPDLLSGRLRKGAPLLRVRAEPQDDPMPEMPARASAPTEPRDGESRGGIAVREGALATPPEEPSARAGVRGDGTAVDDVAAAQALVTVRGVSPELLPVARRSTRILDAAYVAVLITPFGIRPIRSAADLDVPEGTPSMVYGLDAATLDGSARVVEGWSAGNGVATVDGMALFDPGAIRFEVG